MILPLRVFGRPGTKWIRSGVAIAPISVRTAAAICLRISSASPPARSVLRMTKA